MIVRLRSLIGCFNDMTFDALYHGLASEEAIALIQIQTNVRLGATRKYTQAERLFVEAFMKRSGDAQDMDVTRSDR